MATIYMVLMALKFPKSLLETQLTWLQWDCDATHWFFTIFFLKKNCEPKF